MSETWYTNIAWYQYLVAAIPYVAFVVMYQWRTPSWRGNPIGRGLMTQAASMAAILMYVLLILAVEVPASVQEAMRALLLAGITIGGTLMLRNLLNEQKAKRDEKVLR